MQTTTRITFRERHRLGKRAFFLFLVRRIKLPVGILVATILFWYFDNLVPIQYAYLNSYIVTAGFLLTGAMLLFKIMRTYLEYVGYSFKFEKEYFEISHGYFAKSEISIAYHQIQHVKLRSGYLDQIMGICHLTLVMTGNNPSSQEQDKVVLPAIGKVKGRLIQKELMHQARRHFYRPQEELEPPDENTD